MTAHVRRHRLWLRFPRRQRRISSITASISALALIAPVLVASSAISAEPTAATKLFVWSLPAHDGAQFEEVRRSAFVDGLHADLSFWNTPLSGYGQAHGLRTQRGDSSLNPGEADSDGNTVDEPTAVWRLRSNTHLVGQVLGGLRSSGDPLSPRQPASARGGFR
jgi:hypothetical protein